MAGALARALALLATLALAAAACWPAAPLARPDPGAGPAAGSPPGIVPPGPEPALELRFLDVGQGDAVLIRVAGGRAVLYDGGQDGARLQSELEAAGVTSLELVIASHNHADHIGGLVEAIARYRPRFIMDNDIPHTTRTYERFIRAVLESGTQRLEPGRRVIMLDRVRLTVIPPPGRPDRGQNENSVGLLVELGSFRATLLGDSEAGQQAWWLEHHGDLFQAVTVHKASHHGSVRGDTDAMMAALRPAIVVIGVGIGNPYGHPHERALARYRAAGARVYRTDRDGTVVITVEPGGGFAIR
jgi:competence protein ComEC